MRKTLILLMVLLILVPAAVVMAGGQKESAQAQAGPRKVMKVGVANFAWRWDPAVKYSNNTAQMHINMHDGLVRVSPYQVPFEIRPSIAESWEEISDTVVEFKLRDAKFWDGTDVTAEDVAWSINRSLRGDHPRYSSYVGRWGYNFEKVEVVDAKTVRVHLKRPDPLKYVMLAQTPASILSKDAYEAAGDPDKFFEHPVGCGPYRIADYKPDQYIKLERWDGYWGEQPPLDELYYYSVPETSARITALMNGELDFIVSVPPDQEIAIQGRKGIKSMGVTWDMFHVFALNATREPLDDLNVRRAMNLAVDREALNESFWQGDGVVPTAFQYPGRMGYDPDWKVFEYNPEKAKKLVEESDYDGEPIELNFGASYYLYIDQATQAYAEMLKDVGLNVKLQYVEDWGEREDPKDYVMTRSWSNPMYFPDMLGGFDPHWAPTSWPIADGLNPLVGPGGKLRDEYMALYDTARYGNSEDKRLEAYHELVEFLNDKVAPWVILYQPREFFAMADDIEWEVPVNYRPFTLPFRNDEDLKLKSR
ncbi:MAG: hypothetical protein DRJ47_08995 [Thermoprotei archaeon]|nr:MAG: hypothetical protein DRJ47_08995 [Thermoprotei archaeon]